LRSKEQELEHLLKIKDVQKAEKIAIEILNQTRTYEKERKAAKRISQHMFIKQEMGRKTEKAK